LEETKNYRTEGPSWGASNIRGKESRRGNLFCGKRKKFIRYMGRSGVQPQEKGRKHFVNTVEKPIQFPETK